MTRTEIKIDEEFKSLLPALDEKTFWNLERDIIQNGVHTPIVIWNGYIIDGHNRYGICVEHDIPFETIDYSDKLATREDVILWIIMTQISRRNLSAQQLSYYRGRQYQIEKKRVGEHKGNQHSELECGQNDHIPITGSTAWRLAEYYNVSPRTIRRDECVARVIDRIGEVESESRRMILSGKAPINRRELEGLIRAPAEDLEHIARDIADGVYAKNQTLKAPDSSEFILLKAGIDALDSALERIRGVLEKRLNDLEDELEMSGIKERLRKQADAFATLVSQIA